MKLKIKNGKAAAPRLVKAAAPKAGKGLKSMAGRAPSIIDRLVSDRMKVDWVTTPRDEKYQEYLRKDGDEVFYKETLPYWQKKLEELNKDILAEVKTLIKNSRAWIRSSVKFLKDHGFDVKIGKPTMKWDDPKNWVDYTWYFPVTVKDTTAVARGVSTDLNLLFEARERVTVRDRNSDWTDFNSATDPNATFAELAVTSRERLRPGDWKTWSDWRKKKIAEVEEKAKGRANA